MMVAASAAQQCSQCNSSFLCVDGSRERCPLQSAAIDGVCVCVDGWKLLGDGSCALGEAPFYYREGERFECPYSQETLRDGASSRAECVCSGGYAGRGGGDGDACEICAVNTFASTNSSQCERCPENSHGAPEGSSDIAMCGCPPGEIQNENRTCVACPRGHAKGLLDRECIECQAGTWAEQAVSCRSCGENSESPAGSVAFDNCTCLAGAERATGICELCSVGKYNNENASQCENCGAGMTSGEGALSCVCQTGHGTPSVSPTACDKCVPGFFKAQASLGECSECLAGTFSPGAGASACTSCPAHAQSEQGATACVCNAGFLRADSACESCPVDTYSHANATECTPCGRNLESPPGSTSESDCECPRGRGGSDCDLCVAGKYKDTTGLSVCTNCPAFKTTDLVGSISALSCVCDTGATEEENGCVPCVAGRFKNKTGAEACRPCRADTFSAAGASACAVCPAGASTQGGTGQHACGCAAGSFWNATTASCRTCATDTFRLATDADWFSCRNCSLCNAGTYPPSVCAGWADTECAVCPASSSSVAGVSGIAGCLCFAGFAATNESNSSQACEACEAGTFKAEVGNVNSCEECPAGTFQSAAGKTSCVACTLCDEQHWAVGGCNATHDTYCAPCSACPAGKHTAKACVHNASVNIDTVCAGCPANKTCYGGAIHACPADKWLLDESETCTCRPGTFLSGGACTVCESDVYCVGDDVAQACPEGSASDPGSYQRTNCSCEEPLSAEGAPGSFECVATQCADRNMVGDACVCRDGYYLEDGACAECPADSRCNGGVRRDCGAGATSVAGSSICTCMSGWFHNTLTLTCEVCPAGSFCPGDETKHPCADNSASPAGAEAQEDCVCAAGFEPGLADPCRGCGAGKFKPAAGNSACEACASCAQSQFESLQCTTVVDSVCQACGTCAESEFVAQQCGDGVDTACEACAVCRPFEEERGACSVDRNTVCWPRNVTVQCGVGEYVRQTTAGEIDCARCNFENATGYVRAASNGSRFNDPHSCAATCAGHSRLVDGDDHSRGCTSCETGNALLKKFLNATGCRFRCLPGYARVGDACMPIAAPGVAASETTLELAVVGLAWTETGELQISVLHSNATGYAVALGAEPASLCGVRRHPCCFSHMWRASAAEHMRVSSETCSRGELAHTHTSNVTLDVRLAASRVAEIGECSAQFCTLWVSLVDTDRGRSLSRRLQVNLTNTGSLVATSNTRTYVPLSAISADVLRATADAVLVRLVVTPDAGQPVSGVALRSPGFELISADVPDCSRLAVSGAQLATPDFSVNGSTSVVSWWRGSAPVFKLYLTLLGGHGAMDVAVLRNLTGHLPQCGSRKQTSLDAANVAVNLIEGGSGLGRHAVAAMRELANAQPAHGFANTLTTVVARARSADVTAVRLESVITVTVGDEPMRQMRVGAVDSVGFDQKSLYLTEGFRNWCNSPSVRPWCAYGYLTHDSPGAGLRRLVTCDQEEQTGAVAWIKANFRVPGDGGHVDELCAAHFSGTPQLALLINPLAYIDPESNLFRLSRLNTQADPSTLNMTETYVWARFEFVY